MGEKVWEAWTRGSGWAGAQVQEEQRKEGLGGDSAATWRTDRVGLGRPWPPSSRRIPFPAIDAAIAVGGGDRGFTSGHAMCPPWKSGCNTAVSAHASKVGMATV